MTAIWGKDLSTKLREISDRVQTRLWIASPYLGNFPAVRAVLGNRWQSNPNVDVRLITDAAEAWHFSYDTLNAFFNQGTVQHLRGLHAKIFIIDNQALVTSANLTGTAFTKRYEIGHILTGRGANAIAEIFDEWWTNKAELLSPDILGQLAKKKPKKVETEEGAIKGLPKLWSLPRPPGRRKGKQGHKFEDYPLFCSCYKDLAKLYAEKVQRVWHDSPLYLELDGLLDHLFHTEISRPSAKYIKSPKRKLTKNQRVIELMKYSARFRKSVRGKPDSRWRDERAALIQSRLTRRRVKNLSRKDVEVIVNQLHSMTSFPLNMSKFLNHRNNELSQIRAAWSLLLEEEKTIKSRMEECNKKLRHFGRSAIQELVGYRWPDEYPIRNRNTSAGLRFFGYDVKVY